MTKVEAVYDGEGIADVEVKVIVPLKFARPFPEVSPAKTPTAENKVGSNDTRPPWYVPGDDRLGDDEPGLATWWFHVLTVVVWDEFDDVLDSIYDGQKVEERIGTGPWIHIQDIYGGSYPDPVGPFWLRLQDAPGVPPDRDINEYVFKYPENKAIVDGWPDDEENMPDMPLSADYPEDWDQDYDVKVAGHGGPYLELDRRLITTRVGGEDLLEIQSPPDD